MNYYELGRIPKLTEILAEHGEHKLRRNNAMKELYDITPNATSFVGMSKSDERDIAKWRRWLEGRNEW